MSLVDMLMVIGIASAISVTVSVFLWLVPKKSRLQEYKDQDGSQRVLVGVNREGVPGIWLLDKSGSCRASWFLEGEAQKPALILSDAKEVPRCILDFEREDIIRIRLMNSDSTTALWLTAGREGDSTIVLYDKEGNPRISLGSDGEFEPGIGVWSPGGTKVGALGFDGKEGRLVLLTEEGEPTARP